MSLRLVLHFLHDLRQNNEKAWFDTHRSEYEAAHAAFETFLQAVMDELRPEEDFGNTTLKECLFRINRDVRFSKDKTPYKLNMSGVLAKGGRKGTGRGYYISIEPHACMIAVGAFPETAQKLQHLREKIAANPDPLLNFLADETIQATFGALEGEKLKKPPKGFDPTHPAIEILKHKQLYLAHRPTDEQVLAENFVAYTVGICAKLRPLASYLAEVVQE